MTRNDIKQWIREKLGYPAINVELSDEQLDQAVQKAIIWYEANIGGVMKEAELTLVAGQNEYILDEDVIDVVDIYFPRLPLLPGRGALEVGFPWRLVRQEMAGFIAAQVQMESLRKYLGWEHGWEYIPAEHKLRIYPTPSNSIGGMKIVYKYLSKIKDIDDIDKADLDALMEYALAEAKEILVAIRGKYRSVALPAGETELDADRLADEARTAKDKLDEWIRSKASLMGILVT